jgi:hypothetical protein
LEAITEDRKIGVPSWLRSRISSRSLGRGKAGFDALLPAISGFDVWVEDSFEGAGVGVEVGPARRVEVGSTNIEGPIGVVAVISVMVRRG